MRAVLASFAPLIGLLLLGLLFLMLGMPPLQAGLIVFGLALIALPAWWPRSVIRVVGATLLALLAGLVSAGRARFTPQVPEASLQRFASCWLVAVLFFFTLAATKLPVRTRFIQRHAHD
mgnify:CR=1 FL=1